MLRQPVQALAANAQPLAPSDDASMHGLLLLVTAVGRHANATSRVTLAVEPADGPTSLALQSAFFADIASRYPGWKPASSQAVEPSDLGPPTGVWLLAYVDGKAIGCGGLQRFDQDTAEIRRIFLDASARRRGIGRRLLAELEGHAGQLGYERVRLTTGDRQPEALSLFQAAGYQDIDPFTDGIFTRHWMEKRLSGPVPGRASSPQPEPNTAP